MHRKLAAELVREIRAMWPTLQGKWTRREWNAQARHCGRQHVKRAQQFERANR